MAKQLRTAKFTSCDLEIRTCKNYCDSLYTKEMSHASRATADMKETVFSGSPISSTRLPPSLMGSKSYPSWQMCFHHCVDDDLCEIGSQRLSGTSVLVQRRCGLSLRWAKSLFHPNEAVTSKVSVPTATLWAPSLYCSASVCWIWVWPQKPLRDSLIMQQAIAEA